MKKYLLIFAILGLGLTAFGQTQQPPTPPITANVDLGEPVPPPRYEDNVRPLSGIQNFDVGTRTELMNQFIPSFDFSTGYGTNPGLNYGIPGETIWGWTTNAGGSLRLTRGNARKLFSLNYHGNAQFNSYNSDLNTQIHSLDLSQSVTAGRWTVVVGDTLSYLPNAYGGYLPSLFPGTTPQSGSDFKPGVSPSATVITQQNTQLNNTALGQITYGLSRVSTLTGSASYGVLHYIDGNLIDSRQFTSTGGYDHRFGRNTIGMAYTYTKFMYPDLDQSFDTHAVHFTYGRRIIGRWSVDFAAGPTFSRSKTAGVQMNDIQGSGSANLRYSGARSNFGVGYTRAVTSGSGVTLGAVTDSVNFSADRRLSRTYAVNLSMAYSRNAGTTLGNDYNTILGGAGITHDLSPYVAVSLGYTGQRQTSNLAFASFSSQTVMFSLHWRLRPVRME